MRPGHTYHDMDDQIKALNARIDALTEIVDKMSATIDLLPIVAGAPVVNSPTATGYIPLTINGRRINIMIGS